MIEAIMNSLCLSVQGPGVFINDRSAEYLWMKMTPGNWTLFVLQVYTQPNNEMKPTKDSEHTWHEVFYDCV